MNRSSSPRVLVVEDEESYRASLRVLLSREGFRVTLASSGPEAVVAFDRWGADVVLLDLMLPGFNGSEVFRRIRERADVPIIMVTAKDEQVDKIIGLELGADDYVTKPYSGRELVARIRTVLRRASALPSNMGRVLTRQTIIDRVWGVDYFGDTKTLDVHIKRLRSRIEEDPGRPTLIVTVRGVGYTLDRPA
jgi:two-component system response regulator RegX3